MMRLREHEWGTPGSTQFLDQGDRFIPTRSLMNLDLAQCLLTAKENRKKPDSRTVLTPKEEYRRRLEENFALDSEGKPFRMLVFRGSPRKSRNSLLLVDEMRQDDNRPVRQIRHIPTSAERILDGPGLIDDYYLNLMDWGKSNILAVALGPSLYLWNAVNGKVDLLLSVDEEDDHPTSVAWCSHGKMVAVGFVSSRIEIWDVVSMALVRIFEGHTGRVGSLSWNNNILSSGSRDACIINHDVRSVGRAALQFKGHTQEVCGLRWSSCGKLLASGGNDNLVHIWDSSRMGSSKYLFRFQEHSAAVRALAWCPYEPKLLASGGGTADGCIKIWNIQSGRCTSSIDTNAQVCALEWNRHQKEILSAHGYSQHQLSLWGYPSMSKVVDLKGHTQRVLHLSQSPDGATVASAAADETIRFWKVFEPPLSAASPKTNDGGSDGPLSLKRMHIR